MIYRWPGFLPHPLPPSSKQVFPLSQSSCVSLVELTDEKGGGGEPNYTKAGKPGPLLNHSILSETKKRHHLAERRDQDKGMPLERPHIITWL
jgi:hypothetical protein